MALRAAVAARLGSRYFLAAAALCVFLTGCRAGTLELAALDYRSIDPPSAQVHRLELDEAYWWTDEQGNVWIAGRKRATPPFMPEFQSDVQFSLRLGPPPAGAARNYTADAVTLRAVVRVGPGEARLTSVMGIVAAYSEAGETLRVSARILANHQAAQLLGGYSGPTRYLFLARMEARNDATRGRAIADATETQGWARGVKAAPDSRPTTAPASRPVPARNNGFETR